jgi:hypothetical protein
MPHLLRLEAHLELFNATKQFPLFFGDMRRVRCPVSCEGKSATIAQAQAMQDSPILRGHGVPVIGRCTQWEMERPARQTRTQLSLQRQGLHLHRLCDLRVREGTTIIGSTCSPMVT